jgi:hypothetical protein
VHKLFIDFKKAYDSVRREVLYNILIEFGIPKKLVKLIKMFCKWDPIGTPTVSKVFPKHLFLVRPENGFIVSRNMLPKF